MMRAMLPKSLSFVDVETTGSSPIGDRIIEIGIVRVEGDNVTEYSTLLDPGMNVSPFIQDLTGIDARELEGAPSFYEVKDEILELLSDSIFVAHNARFDYGFLRSEFKRYGVSFTSKHMCTVKLSRKLFPRYRKHNLTSLIDRFGFVCDNRHRALDDAKVLHQFYRHVLDNFDVKDLSLAVNDLLKTPSLPPRLARKYLNLLPETPGVYVFYDKSDMPLYIGKSVNIRDRVLSHFSSDYMSGRSLEMVSLIEHIETHQTAGDLSAQLLESKMIKEYQPMFNRQLRYSRLLTVVRRTEDKNGYYRASIEEVDQLDAKSLDSVVGIFKNRKQAKDFFARIAQEHNLCQKLLGIESGKGACFGYHLGWCRGACEEREKAIAYNMRFTEAFSARRVKNWPYRGAVAICEEYAGKQSNILVDQWCILGDVEEAEEVSNIDYLFDFDTYKILLRYLLNHADKVKVVELNNSSESQTSRETL